MSSQIVGQFLMDFGSDDRHIAGSSEAQSYAISTNLQDNDLDVLTNQYLLPGFSAKNQHGPSLQLAFGYAPPFDAVSIKPEGK